MPDQPDEQFVNQPARKAPIKFGLSIAIVIICLVASGVAVYWINTEPVEQSESNIIISKPNIESIELVIISNLPEIKKDLSIFQISESDRLNNYVPEIKYFDAGVVSAGQYKGYRLIVGYASANDPSGGATLLFATNDDKTYLLDKKTESYAIDIKIKDGFINPDKVVGEADLSSEFPPTVALGNFVLVQQDINLAGKKSGDTELASTVPGIKFFASPFSSDAFPAYSTSTSDILRSETLRRFMDTDTNILAQNNNGLSINYLLTSRESFDRSKKLTQPYVNYEDFLLQDEIISETPIYKSYGTLVPWGCGNTNYTYLLKNISENDLEKIGATKNGTDVFALKDKNHDLYKLEYHNKILEAGQYFKEINKIDPPTFQDYMAKNPIIIVKDGWGRWLALGEVEYNLVGGCGKPVIYLYPTKSTEVTVKFIKPIKFTTDIPTYTDGWNVLAEPSGALTDLQPQFTDCSSINENIKGSEYAKAACQANNYPYLYWAGQSFAGIYESPKKGWIVARADLNSFLNSKLKETGLNEIEKSDMLAYWIPELLKKNVPYYRLSFLETNEVNKIIPMIVTPPPDTTLRIFLDWEPLASKPIWLPDPQIFESIQRQGFTLVEWGGLKR